MGVQIYKNGVWTTPVLRIFKNGAWTNVSSVKRYINGAWTEVLQSPPMAIFMPELTSINKPSTTSYNYTVSNNGAMLNYSIRNAVAGGNHVCFRVTKNGGFGNTIKLKYTITQAMTYSAYASVVWHDTDYALISRDNSVWYNFMPRTNETFEGTITFAKGQTYLYFIFEAYEGDLTGSLSNVYINDELITFR